MAAILLNEDKTPIWPKSREVGRDQSSMYSTEYSPRLLDKNNDGQPLEVGADPGYGDALYVSWVKKYERLLKLTQIYGTQFTSMGFFAHNGSTSVHFPLTHMLKVSNSAAPWKYGLTKRSRDCFNRVCAEINNEFNDKQTSSLKSWIVNLFPNWISSPEVSATWLNLSKCFPKIQFFLGMLFKLFNIYSSRLITLSQALLGLDGSGRKGQLGRLANRGENDGVWKRPKQ